MNLRLWTLPVVALALYNTAFAQNQPQNKAFQKGKRLPPVSATAASGRWLERAPFDPATYGKERGVSPATTSEPKIVLYTASLDEDFFKIASAVDTYVGQNPKLGWSFVQVQDAKGAQFGGYSAEELRVRLDEIQRQAQQHGIRHLSFLVAAPGSKAKEPSKTVVLAFVRPVNTKSFPVIEWVTENSSSDLQGKALTETLASLDTVVRSNPVKTGK